MKVSSSASTARSTGGFRSKICLPHHRTREKGDLLSRLELVTRGPAPHSPAVVPGPYQGRPQLATGRESIDLRRLRVVFVCVDVGFIVYWVCAGLGLFPQEWLFKDYESPIFQAWNFSFLPLDLLISATGFGSLYCLARGNEAAQPLALISLVLTFCSGLQAIAFWGLRQDYDLSWWAPNLFLMVYPLYFLIPVLRRQLARTTLEGEK
jgi:hypothetical protein